MRVTRWAFYLALSAAFFLPMVAAADEKPAAKEASPTPPADKQTAGNESPAEAVFDLEEFSVLDTNDVQSHYEFRLGQREGCGHQPDPRVKAYPKLVSDKPWYGSVRFDRTRSDADSGQLFYFVVDESRGLGTGNYRLYFDANQDRDLTNDPVVERMKDPPPGAALPWTSKQSAAFDYVTVELDQGSELGKRPVKIMPRLTVNEYNGQENASMGFVRATARRGKINIGDREYDVLLGHTYTVSGRFDGPAAAIHLTPAGDAQRREYWWGADRLNAMRCVGGRWYRLAATPAGDKLFVRPYTGEVGVFEIGPGKRKLEKVSISGSLLADGTAVPVGDLDKGTPGPTPTRRCSLPEGDYTFYIAQIEFGSLSICVSNNYHTDGKPLTAPEKKVYGIHIRRDKPFVFDFSNKPDVLFASPARDQTFKPGDEISVKAVLIDPELDVMIRGLDQMEPEATSEEPENDAATKDVDKEESLFDKIVKAVFGAKPKATTATPALKQRQSLDPVVTITDSSGKKVAGGKMPFG